MSTVTAALDANRSAVEALKQVAGGCTATWTTPRAPGKWSPAQVVEHIALSLEASADEVAGRPSNFPSLPRIMHPLTRIFMRRVVKTGKFIKAKTNAAMDPATGPATPDSGITRLDAAWHSLEAACRAAPGDTVTSGVFGRVPLADYLIFQQRHTQHHTAQMTW